MSPRPAYAATFPTPASMGGRARDHAAVAVIATTQLMLVVDSAVVNIALPSLQSDLGLSDAMLSWTVTGYILAFGGLLLVGGRSGDLFGRRRTFIAGLAVFTLASLAGGFATSGEMLIASRVVQGAGAAFASPTALALISTMFVAGPVRNRALAVYGAASGAGTAVGVIVGGLLTGFLTWRAVMFVNVPFGVAAIVGALLVLRESPRRHARIDLGGALVGSLGIGMLVFGITLAAESPRGWGDPAVASTVVAGVVLVLVFLVIEGRVRAPLLPLGIFRHRTRSASLIAVLLLGLSLAMTYFQSLFVQQVLGYSALEAGLAFTPTAVGLALGSWVAARLLARWPAAAVAGLGMALGAAGILGQASLTVDASYAPDVLVPVILWALGMGLTFVPLTLAVIEGVPESETGAASGAMGTLQQVGGALGLSVLVAIASSVQGRALPEAPAALADALADGDDATVSLARDAITDGFASALTVSAAALVVAFVVVVCLVRTRRTQGMPAGSQFGAP